jgi:predicted flap endonuclease-1-like 5' DNA nuclease
MSHLVMELVLWMLAAFFIGCLIGWMLKTLFATEKPVAVSAPAARVPAPEPVRAPPPPRLDNVTPPIPAMPPMVPEPPRPAALAEPAAAMGRPERPKGIAKAREGGADELQRISGVGPKNERVLHNLGFFHFDQIAAWTSEQVAWVDDHLKFNGRIKREEWIRQARLLAEGNEAEFEKLYGTGGMRSKSGETKPGDRTRKR